MPGWQAGPSSSSSIALNHHVPSIFSTFVLDRIEQVLNGAFSVDAQGDAIGYQRLKLAILKPKKTTNTVCNLSKNTLSFMIPPLVMMSQVVLVGH